MAADLAFSMKHIFEKSEEIVNIAKKHNIDVDLFREMTKDDIKKHLQSLAGQYKKCPSSNLEEKHAYAKKMSGIFSSWEPCTIVMTKEE